MTMKQLRVFGLQTSNNIVIFSIASYAQEKVPEIHNIMQFLNLIKLFLEKQNKTTDDVTQDNLRR